MRIIEQDNKQIAQSIYALLGKTVPPFVFYDDDDGHIWPGDTDFLYVSDFEIKLSAGNSPS